MADLPPELLTYLANRDRQRMDRVNQALATLRPYERRLVREAAVMGYVLGHSAGESAGRRDRDAWRSTGEPEEPFPSDTQILTSVIAHCESSADTYPYIGMACHGHRRRITAARRWPGEENNR